MNNLEDLIIQYAHNKQEMDDYKKICDKENTQIKELMSQEGITEKEAGNYVAKYQVQKRESMNEDMLLEIAHIHGIPEIVKTKEYIDFDALEDAIYKGKIAPNILSEMNKAREVKEVKVLKITKKKEVK